MLGLNPTLVKALNEAFSITDPTPIQSEAIPILLEASGVSGDVVMQAQTGSGKTLAYALPLLDLILSKYNPNTTPTPDYREEVGTVGLIIVPTRELAAQTQVTLTKLLSRVRPHWIVTTALTGGDSRKSEKARLRRGCQIVVGTPGRLLDHLKTSEGWKRSKLAWLVVDEADRLADLGFENTIKDIFSTLSMALHRIRMVLVSATVTEKLKVEFAGRKLKSPQFIKAGPKKQIYQEETAVAAASAEASEESSTISSSTAGACEEFSAPVAIDQIYLHTPTKLRLQILVGLLRSFFPLEAASNSCRVIVFFSCCDSVDFHYDLFRMAGEGKQMPAFLPPRVKLLRLHGNLDQATRISTFNEFIKEGSKTSTAPVQTVLFCTDVAARGLDFPNLAGSVQYDAPCDIHDYIHRAGRTGRLNNSGSASSTKSKSVIFLMPSEEAYIARLQNMGMSSLHKEAFDEYLKWVEKLDAAKLQSLLAKHHKKKASAYASKKKSQDEADGGDSTPEAEPIAALPSTLKARLNLLQKVIELGILSNEELVDRARNAFLSTCRAYATHPSAEKDVFHIKRLHLGHLAAAFGLDREPKKMVKHAFQASESTYGRKRNYNNADDSIPEEIIQGSSKMRKEIRDKNKFASQHNNYEKHQQRRQNPLSFNNTGGSNNNNNSNSNRYGNKNIKNNNNNNNSSNNNNSYKKYNNDDDEKVTFAY